jgi:hypothetical protein
MMRKEIDLPLVDYERLANSLGEVFINRWDVYAKQLDDGSYICIHEPLTPQNIAEHLMGEVTLGVYLLDAESKAKYIVLDADNQTEKDQIIFIGKSLAHHGVASYLEESRRGGHLWFFFGEPETGIDARLFGRGILSRYTQSAIELYPKQEELTSGPGSLIRLPFGIHRKSGQRYGFINLDGDPLAPSLVDQIDLLSDPETVSDTAFDAFWIKGEIDQEVSDSNEATPEGQTLSQRIKNSITAFDFIRQYIKLTSRGKGKCPFHDDNVSSFSVHLEGNYWHCFAGCGGGSIIDFWMKWRECDFIPAVAELAGMLLDE